MAAVSGGNASNCHSCRQQNVIGKANIYCKSCDERLCTRCADVHITVVGRGVFHEVIDIGSVENELDLDMLGMDKCELHGQTVRFYCGDHDELCCNLCALVTGKHRGCDNFKELTDVEDEQAIDKTSSLLRSVHSHATTLLSYYEQQETELNLQQEAIIINITDKQTRLLTQLHTSKSDVLMEACEQRDGLLQAIGEYGSAGSKMNNKSGVNSQWLNAVLTKGTSVQLFMIVHTIYNDNVNTENQLKEHVQRLETYGMTADYIDDLHKLITLVDGVGEALFETIQSGIPSKLTLKLSAEQVKTGNDNKEPLYTGLVFLSKDRNFVVDNYNNTCRILNEKLQIVGSPYTKSYFVHSACTVAGNTVAVTTSQPGIDILQVSDNSDITPIKTLKTTCFYDSISLMNDSTFIASTYNNHRSVRMISMDGVESDLTTVTFPDKTYKLGESFSAFIPGRDTLVITDRYDDTVYMYNIKNNTKLVIKDERIKRPTGVCVGDNDNVYVCSSDTRSVVQIYAIGRIVSVHEVDIACSYVACVSKDGSNIVVANNCSGKHHIKLFECSSIVDSTDKK